MDRIGQVVFESNAVPCKIWAEVSESVSDGTIEQNTHGIRQKS